MVPFRLVRWIAQGENVIVYGDGSQERDFTYVDDIAKGTVSAIKKVGFEIMNLGNDRPVKLSELISLIELKLEKKARIVEHKPHITDVSATWADISRSKKILGWKPEVDVEKGLDLVIDWYKKNTELANSIEL